MPQVDLKLLVKGVDRARDRFLCGLEKTPDSRLEYVADGEMHTPLKVAGRLVAYTTAFSQLLSTGGLPGRPAVPPPPPATREAAIAAVTSGMNGLRDAIASLTDSDLERTFTAPWGSEVSFAEVVWWIPGVLAYAQGQLNLIQLGYGDTDPNLPPSWFASS